MASQGTNLIAEQPAPLFEFFLNWNMFMGMAFGLVAFVGGVLVMGGSFLIRTHLRDYDSQS